jgi:hypothetical protein
MTESDTRQSRHPPLSPFFAAAKGEGKNIDFPPRGGIKGGDQ